MPSEVLTVAGVSLGAAVAVGVAVRPVLRRLPEPVDGEGKPAYRDLATGGFVLGCALASAALVALAGWALPRSALPLWWALAVVGVPLAAVDLRTTWLPLGLTRAAWAAMAGATLVAAGLAGPGLLLRAAAGAAVASGLFWLFWRLSRGGIGFGDVRFVPLLGAASAAVDWPLLVATLVLGTLAGAVLGLVRLARRQPGVFAYAPSLLAGAYLACLLRLRG